MDVRPLRGIILILVSGILVVTALAAVFFIQAGLLSTRHAEADLSRIRAGIAAVSGLEYASSRLRQEPSPLSIPSLPPNPATRGDDWTCRDLLPAATAGRSSNPSYAHGDGWVETVPDGIHTSGEAVLASQDLDNDGILDVASGRLRGPAGASPVFSLRVAASQSLACVNSGELGAADGDHDADGILNAEDPDYDVDLGGTSLPDWQDTAFEGNLHLINLLNNLGAIVGLPLDAAALYDPGHPGALINTSMPYEVSDLGRRVVENRPRGGYASIAQLKQRLVPTFYTAAQFALVKPYLAAGGDVIPVPFPDPDKRNGYSVFQTDPEKRFEFHARVDANLAPLPILKATLRYISASSCFYRSNTLPPNQYKPLSSTPFVRLGKDEADAIAGAIAAARPIRSWKRVLEVVSDPALSYQDDLFTVGDDPGTTSFDESNDVIGERRRLKEDLILAQVSTADFLYDPYAYRAGSLEVPRQGTWADGALPRRIVKSYLAGPLNTFPYNAAGVPVPVVNQAGLNAINGIPARMTTEWNLVGRPGRFALESEGIQYEGAGKHAARRRLSMETAAERHFSLSSQQDFEPVSVPFRAVDPSSPWQLSGGDLAYDLAAPPQRSGTQTGPRFPIMSQTTGSTNYDSSQFPPPPSGPPVPDPHLRHPWGLGSLSLSARQWTDTELTTPIAGATVVSALPFNEDRAGAPPANLYDPTSAVDNLTDPVTDPVLFLPRSTMAGPWLWPQDHPGILWGPSGRRYEISVSPQHSPHHVFGVTWTSFPLARADYPGPPVVLGGGEITQGTIAFWAPARGGASTQSGMARSGKFRLKYLNTQTAPYPNLLEATVQDDASLAIRSASTPAAVLDAPTANPMFPGLSAWHHYAISFDDVTGPNDGKTGLYVYVDGILSPDTPLGSPWIVDMIDPSKPPEAPPCFLDIREVPIDDIAFYKESLHLTPDRIKKLASLERFHPTGTYRSTRFVFDATRFPDGAAPTGAAWDAFIPNETGGRFTFDLLCYQDAAGTVLLNPNPGDPGRSISWNGSGLPTASFKAPPCRAFALEVRIETSPTLLLDDGSGIPVPALRDTPVLDEFRVLYAPPGILRTEITDLD